MYCYSFLLMLGGHNELMPILSSDSSHLLTNNTAAKLMECSELPQVRNMEFQFCFPL